MSAQARSFPVPPHRPHQAPPRHGSARADPDDPSFDAADEADEPQRFCVDLDGFEGPLHLLLSLAREQKVDLHHISILALADQYLAFIDAAKHKRIDIAADYLVMAAWLAYLKSRLLLPKPPKLDPKDTPETDAYTLTFRLARLDSIRRNAKALMERRILGRDVFTRGMPETYEPLRARDVDEAPAHDLYDLMRAYGEIVRKQAKARIYAIRPRPVLALADARKRLELTLQRYQDWAPLSVMAPDPADLPSPPPRSSALASTFFAALELARDGTADLRQADLFSELYLRGCHRSERSKGSRHPGERDKSAGAQP